MLIFVSMKLRAWLVPAASEGSGLADIPPELLDAWNAAVREWDWKGPATRAFNVDVIQRHYDVDREVAAGLPPSLAVEWCREGRPEPSAWIDAKLASILAEGRRRSVA